MNFFVIFSILAIALGANARNIKDEVSDKDMFLRVIACAQKAVVNGIPEIGIPGHDPLLIPHNFSTEVASVGDFSVVVSLTNLKMEGIPWWNVTQMDDVTEKAENPVFDYTIYWKLMSLEGLWNLALLNTGSNETVFQEGGEFGFELDHLTFNGLFNFSKPEDTNEVGFNELTLHFHTEESDVHIDDIGVFSDVIHLVGGPLLRDLVNYDLVADVAGPAIRDKLNKDWVHKPERIEAMMANCGETSLF